MLIKKIFSTAAARIINAALSLLILSINARELGAEAVGTIGLIVLAIAIIQNINSLTGGAPVVYFISRIPAANMMIISYIWSICSSIAGSGILYLFQSIPEGYFIQVMILSLILSLGQIHQMWLLGTERIALFNIISVLQFVLTIGALCFEIYIMKSASVDSYIHALFIAYSAVFVFGFAATIAQRGKAQLKGLGNNLVEMLRYGFLIQLAAISQLLNNRLSYFIIRKYLGLNILGHFDVGIKVSEGSLLPAKSISMVQYARISSTKDKTYARDLTISLFKLSLIVALLTISLLICLPDTFYGWVFGKDFSHIRRLMIYLAPGILSMASGMIFSHYFSGTGRPGYNTAASAIGLIVIAIAGFLMIPQMGIEGAAIATSISYICSLMFQWLSFIRLAKPDYKSFLPNSDDIRMIKEFWRQLHKNSKS